MQMITCFTGILACTVFTCQAFMCSGPIDCQDVQDGLRYNETGVYTIFPQGTYGFKVRCDMDTTTGGWTVIQRRVSNAENFYRTWNDYQRGFGDLDGNFWLGNQRIHEITSKGWYQLRIDMTLANGTDVYVEYNVFKVGNIESEYKLTVDGHNGEAPDNFISPHNGMKFTTTDRDNDNHVNNCATLYKGGWWYDECHYSNLNGVFNSTEFGKGLTWHSLTGYSSSLSFVEMKIKRGE